MKISSYIIMVFFVFVIGCTLVLFISAKGHEKDNVLTNKEYLLGDADINVIVAEPEALIRIHTFDTSSVSIHYPMNERVPENFYRVSNDTLYVSKMVLQNQESRRVDIYIKDVALVIAKKNSDVRITSFFSDSLTINAEQARVEINNASLEEISIQASHSNISMYSNKVASVFAKIENESIFRTDSKEVGKIDVEKDQSSRYNVH